MIYFLNGIIKFKNDNQIVIDVHDVGYQVLVSHPDDYEIGETVFLFTHNVVREDEEYLVGFKDEKEKAVFLALIRVKGLGPKTVINALSATTPDNVVAAISSNNLAYLKKLPGIGAKAAGQILLDLKGEYTGEKGNPHVYEEAFDALKSLGFKGAVIDRVLETINEPNATVTDIVKIALSKLRTK